MQKFQPNGVSLNYQSQKQVAGDDVLGVTLKKPVNKNSALKFQPSSNKHTNFKDLKPVYDKMKYGRAVDLARVWVGQLGEKIKVKVKKEEIRIWNADLEAGKRLSYLQLRNLNTVFKKEYVKAIMKDDDQATEYIA